MPSVSKKQHNLMAAVANNPAFAKKTGIPKSVGEDYLAADKGKKFTTRADSQVANRPKTNHGDMALFKKGGSMASKMNPGFMAMMAKKKESKPMDKPAMKSGTKKPMDEMMGMKKGGMKKMAAGGLSSGHKAADGVASKGKTKGKMLAKGGKTC